MKFYKTFNVILVCVFIVGDSNEYYIVDCPFQYINNGYYHFDGGYYKLHTTPQCWANARSICDAEGAHLAIINSQSEANFLVNLMNQYYSQNYMRVNQYNNELLIGFHDLYRDGEYVTVEGQDLETAGYNSWVPGQPNELFGQNCGSMSNRGRLNDFPCSMPSIFACEVTKFTTCDNVGRIRAMPRIMPCDPLMSLPLKGTNS
ncbi:hemolymph lipopolysaccharide-binding protein-like [Chrysoperla carnea]|uniref:hemolymph lipopolysaccharide-binding protein-like n=1 Tax=Chrysoperla carnea TaxID=189513 RepID=UPI001D08D2FF|nr:hemolymph lipopolysaccharide-binding protein-like [Chrysoperla carnea]